MTKLRRFLDDLSQSPHEARAENLRLWMETIEGITAISEVVPRQRARVAGVINNIRIDPREGSGSIEATFIDGTGHMLAKWLGRQALQGITLGMGIVVEGVIGTDPGGEHLILNPEYRLVPGPEHGLGH